MKKLFFFLLLICAALFSTCKKISNSKIDACFYVKEYKTETPIANAQVIITRGKPGNGIGTEVVETLYTDNDGMASYKTKVDKD